MNPLITLAHYQQSAEQLAYSFANHEPVVAFVDTQFLDHWEHSAAHAVVLVGMETNHKFWLHDPELAQGPVGVS